MANRLQIQYHTGFTVYVLIRNQNDEVWNGSNFVAYTSVVGLYDIPLSEIGTSGWYSEDFPAGIAEIMEPYSVVAYVQLGVSPAEGDVRIGTQDYVHTRNERIMPLVSGVTYAKRPHSGNRDIDVRLQLIGEDGSGQQADGLPTAVVTDHDGGALSGNIFSALAWNASDQCYVLSYRIASTHDEIAIDFDFAYDVNSVTRNTIFTMFVADDFDQINDVLDVNLIQIGGDTVALGNFRDMYQDVLTRGTVDDLSPTAGGFDTDLTEADDFFNDASITFIEGTLSGQTKRIATYLNASGAITLAAAFTGAPANGNAFFIIGRIE